MKLIKPFYDWRNLTTWNWQTNNKNSQILIPYDGSQNKFDFTLTDA
jgi:hypothetical protein